MLNLIMTSHKRIGNMTYGPQDYKVKFAIEAQDYPHSRGSIEIAVRIQVHGNQIYDVSERAVKDAAFKELMNCRLK